MNFFRKTLVKKLHIINDYTYAKFRDFYRDRKFWLKFRWKKVTRINTFYFIIDPNIPQPGFADRIKAIVYAAHLTKIAGLQFKLIYDELNNYLQPSNTPGAYPNWKASFDELEYSITQTKIWRLYYKKLRPLKNCGYQYHCYNYLGNMLPTQFEDNGDLWHEEYHRLFKPSQQLQKAIVETGLEQGKYKAIHLRFVNALDPFERDYDNSLPEIKKEELICRCKLTIKKIKSQTKLPIVVFSDSKRFLNSLSDMEVIVLNNENIGHIGMRNQSKKVFLKTLLDFYLISRANEVYSVGCPEIYANSAYPQVAAQVGNIPFKRIEA